MKTTSLFKFISHFSVLKFDFSNYESNKTYKLNDFDSSIDLDYSIFVEQMKCTVFDMLINDMRKKGNGLCMQYYSFSLNHFLNNAMHFNENVIDCIQKNIMSINNLVILPKEMKMDKKLRLFMIDNLNVNIQAIRISLEFADKLQCVKLYNMNDDEMGGYKTEECVNKLKIKCRVSYIYFIAMFRAMYDCQIINISYHNSNDEAAVAEILYDTYLIKNNNNEPLKKDTFIQYFKKSSSLQQKNKEFRTMYRNICSFLKKGR